MIYVRLIIDHFQLLSLNSAIRTSWPWYLQSIYRASEAATGRVELIQLQCSFHFDHTVRFYVFLGLPVVFFAQISLIYFLVGLLARFRMNEVNAYKSAPAQIKLEPESPHIPAAVMDAFDADEDGEGEKKEAGWVDAKQFAPLVAQCLGRDFPAAEGRAALHRLGIGTVGHVNLGHFKTFLADRPHDGWREDKRVSGCCAGYMSTVSAAAARLHFLLGNTFPTVPETEAEWTHFKDHAVQVFLMCMVMAYITLANEGLGVPYPTHNPC